MKYIDKIAKWFDENEEWLRPGLNKAFWFLVIVSIVYVNMVVLGSLFA